MKNVQITSELFFELVRYFIVEDTTNERFNNISKQLEEKIDKLAKHEIYTKSKTAETEQEREENRKKYLDMVGIHKDFRY